MTRGLPAVREAEDRAGPEDGEASSSLLRRAGRVGWNMLVILLPIFLLTGLAVGLGYVRLMHGPISLKPLAGPIARAIGSELPGLDIRIEDAVLRIAQDGRLEFRLKHVQLFEQDGDLVASAPEAAAQLSVDGVWAGRIVPSRVDLIEPKLNLIVSDDGSVALSFTPVPVSKSGDGAEPAPKPGARLDASATPGKDTRAAVPAPANTTAGAAEPPSLKRIDLARMLTDATRRARRGLDATSYLREVGMRDATITLESRRNITKWLVPEVSIDLEHKKRSSVIAGLIKVASSAGPWSIAFRTEENDKARTLVLKTTIRDFVPRSIEGALPTSGLLQSLDLPIASDATIELSSEGEIKSGTASVELGRGRIGSQTPHAPAFGVDGGLLHIDYDAANRRFELKPSQVKWGGSQLTLAGTMTGGVTTDGRPGWAFQMAGSDGTLRADDLKLPALAIDGLSARGHWLPDHGRLQLSSFDVKAGGAAITVNGEVDLVPAQPGMRFEARASAMPLDTFKTLWPQAVSPGARKWVGQRLQQAKVKGGTLTYLSGSHLAGQAAGASGLDRLSMVIEAADIVLQPLPTMSPIEAPKALVNIENAALEISVPDAAVAIGPGRRVPLKSLRFAVADLDLKIPEGEISFRVQGGLQPVLAVLDQEPLTILQKAGHSLEGVDGKVEGQIKLLLPLAPEIAARDVKVLGKARVFDARGTKAFGGHAVQGATVNFDFAEQSIDAKGEMLVGGVLAKIAWQHIYDADDERQPPLRLSAMLDNSDRNQLGLDLGQILLGDVPVDVTATRVAGAEPVVRLRADLTKAEIVLDAVAWKKPAGRSAYVQFDVIKGKGRTDLANFKLAGDDVAIEGAAVLGADNKLREFAFPDFTLNVVSRLDVRGKLGTGDVWEIKARGTTFDGRDYFRSLFSVGQNADRAAKSSKPRGGVDLEADIDTVLGFTDASMKGLRVKLSRRMDKLVSLEAKGALDSGKPLAVALRNDGKDQRRLLADTTDAGLAFKLIGFYPNLQGGRGRLEVNLDGKGAAEKTGILWVDDFIVLGDPVVAEVVGSAGDDPIDRTGARTKQRMVRQAFNFDRMKAPFSVGHGQFVLDDTYVKGPILGANIRGKVDFQARTVNLGGTYVPLQGLNNVLGDIPLLGQILSGPRSEGIFGITFAIQGAMAQPQVIVNPLSLLTPGITRELTQMAPLDAAVQVREEKPAPGKGEARTRASSTPASAPQRAPNAKSGTSGRATNTIDGWSSETKSPPQKK